MTLDPAIFKDYNDLEKGDRVRFLNKDTLRGGQGSIELIWMGIEEMCEIKTDNGDSITVCRALGDTVEKLGDE